MSQSSKSEREARQAEALRANLRKRKAAQRKAATKQPDEDEITSTKDAKPSD